jgi:hypothetical protein
MLKTSPCPWSNRDGTPMFDFVTDLKKSVRQPHEPIFDTTDFRSQWRQAYAKLGLGTRRRKFIAVCDRTIFVARRATT